MPRETEKIDLPCSSPGTLRQLQAVHRWGPRGQDRAYIQASLHADEIPGMLVANHLCRLLDRADACGLVLNKEIVVIPFANPIGLSQNILGSHMGRFSLSSGTNFNRDWPDVGNAVIEKIRGKLTQDADRNVATIRAAILEELESVRPLKEDAAMKHALFRLAATADIALDLHCDSDAVMHMYTHDNLWPEFSDLASELASRCQLLAADSGGNCFDEACSCLWAAISNEYPDHLVPMACQSCTVELRGDREVYDDMALTDATALFRFLQRRGYIGESKEFPVGPLPNLLRMATPLTGVEMIEAPAAGVIAWNIRAGDHVNTGDVLGEIVDVADLDAPRIAVVSRTCGIVFGMRGHKLVRPGEIIVKVSGEEPLEWRKGYLLTA
ncbi:unnamed protein product [Ectocarpus fasciculatus]